MADQQPREEPVRYRKQPADQSDIVVVDGLNWPMPILFNKKYELVMCGRCNEYCIHTGTHKTPVTTRVRKHVSGHQIPVGLCLDKSSELDKALKAIRRGFIQQEYQSLLRQIKEQNTLSTLDPVEGLPIYQNGWQCLSCDGRYCSREFSTITKHLSEQHQIAIHEHDWHGKARQVSVQQLSYGSKIFAVHDPEALGNAQDEQAGSAVTFVNDIESFLDNIGSDPQSTEKAEWYDVCTIEQLVHWEEVVSTELGKQHFRLGNGTHESLTTLAQGLTGSIEQFLESSLNAEDGAISTIPSVWLRWINKPQVRGHKSGQAIFRRTQELASEACYAKSTANFLAYVCTCCTEQLWTQVEDFPRQWVITHERIVAAARRVYKEFSQASGVCETSGVSEASLVSVEAVFELLKSVMLRLFSESYQDDVMNRFIVLSQTNADGTRAESSTITSAIAGWKYVLRAALVYDLSLKVRDRGPLANEDAIEAFDEEMRKHIARFAYPDQTPNVYSVLNDQMTYVMNERVANVDARFVELDDERWIIGETEIHFDDIRTFYHKLLNEIDEMLRSDNIMGAELFRKSLSEIRVGGLRDMHHNRNAGYSALLDDRNGLRGKHKVLLRQLLKGRQSVPIEEMRVFLEKCQQLLSFLLCAMHVESGGPCRAPSWCGARLVNTPTYKRALRIFDSSVGWVLSYNKSQNVTGRQFLSFRTLSKRLGQRAVIYFAVISPLVAVFTPWCKIPIQRGCTTETRKRLTDDQNTMRDTILEFVCVMQGKVMTPLDLSSLFCRTFEMMIGKKLAFNAYRHITQNVIRKIVQPGPQHAHTAKDTEAGISSETLLRDGKLASDLWRRNLCKVNAIHSLPEKHFLEKADYNHHVAKRPRESQSVEPSFQEIHEKSDDRAVMEKALSVMETKFRFKSFKSNDQAQLFCVMRGQRDAICVLPAGGGKSLPVILLPSVEDKVTVSILFQFTSLLEQTRKLDESDTDYTLYNDSIKDRDSIKGNLMIVQIDSVENVKYRQLLLELERDNNLQRVVLDEVHLVDEPLFISAIPHLKFHVNLECPFFGLTATLPPEKESDLAIKLGLKDPYILRKSCDRPGAKYSITQVMSKEKATEKLIDLAMSWTLTSKERAIVFVLSDERAKEMQEELSPALLAVGVFCYHSGMTDDEKKKAINMWSSFDYAAIMVATECFSAGVDHPHVRQIVFLDGVPTLDIVKRGEGCGGRSAAETFGVTVIFCKALMEDRLTGYLFDDAIKFWLTAKRCLHFGLLDLSDGHGLCCSVVPGCQKCDVCSDSRSPRTAKPSVVTESVIRRRNQALANQERRTAFIALASQRVLQFKATCILCFMNHSEQDWEHRPRSGSCKSSSSSDCYQCYESGHMANMCPTRSLRESSALFQHFRYCNRCCLPLETHPSGLIGESCPFQEYDFVLSLPFYLRSKRPDLFKTVIEGLDCPQEIYQDGHAFAKWMFELPLVIANGNRMLEFFVVWDKHHNC